MDSSIAKVLSHVYELEGLLLVAEKHGVETPKMVFDRIHQVALEVSGMAQMLECKSPAEVAPASMVVAPKPVEPMPQPQPRPVASPPAPKPVPPVPKPTPSPTPQPAEVTVPSPVVPPPPAMSEPMRQPVLRVDEQLQRHLSQNLRNAFSLNDRFRFKRNLFNDDEALMEKAIDRVERMSSEQEARSYFLYTFHWDENDPDVVDFLKIISSHYA